MFTHLCLRHDCYLIAGSSVPNLMGMAGGGPGYGGYSPNLSDKYGQLGYMTDTMLRVSSSQKIFNKLSIMLESILIHQPLTSLRVRKGCADAIVYQIY